MPLTFHTEYIEQTASTNDDLKRRALSGEAEGLVLVAGRQTGGRGRLGRSFHSPGGCGLYASVLLRPSMQLSNANLLTCYAAVVLKRAIGETATGTIGIKWVNDIYRNGRKVCGILTESSADTSGNTAYVVIGFGVNLVPPDGGYPEEIAEIAGSVFDDKGCFSARQDALLTNVLNGLSAYESALLDGSFMQEYCESSILNGVPVSVRRADTSCEATALDIDAQGRLHVRYGDGSEAYLIAGDVSIRMR